MSTELEHLRTFRTADGAPDAAARAAARAALLERIAATATAPAAAPARRRAARRSRGPLLAVVLGFATTAAAAAVLVLAIGAGSGGVQPATAAEALRAAADVAAAAPDVVLRQGEYWYTRSKSRQPGHADGGRIVREEWAASDGRGRFAIEHPDGRVDRYPRQGPVTYTFFPRPLTDAQVHAMPVDVDALYRRIEHAGAVWARGNGLPAADRRKEMFTIVGDWLRSTPPLPSSLRAALYRVAARLPGISLLGRVRDPLGREGLAVALVVGAMREELVFDPATAQLLMERDVWDRSGRLVSQAVYVKSGAVRSMRERPPKP